MAEPLTTVGTSPEVSAVAAFRSVTAALARWFGGSLPPATYKAFDFVSIMSFDHCAGTPCEHSTYDAATKEIEFFMGRGIPMDRLVLGVPFYCHCWGAAVHFRRSNSSRSRGESCCRYSRTLSGT